MPKKYFIGDGYFHENKWVNGINMPTSRPGINDESIMDNRSQNFTFGYKSKYHRFIYNIIHVIRYRTFKYWDQIPVGSFNINTTGTVTIMESAVIFNAPKSGTITYPTPHVYAKGTVNFPPIKFKKYKHKRKKRKGRK
jgi:hypothetical protein